MLDSLSMQDVLMATTFLLSVVLVVLVLLYLLVRAIDHRAHKRVINTLTSSGMIILDEKSPKKKKTPSEKEKDTIMVQLHKLVEKENELKAREHHLEKKVKEYESAQVEEHDKNDKKGKNKEKEVRPTIIVEKGMDADVKKVLLLADHLLEKLPDEEVKEFVKSPEFALYKKVLKQAHEQED